MPSSGFTDVDINRTSKELEAKRRLIQTSLYLRDEDKFAAVDPKLWAAHHQLSKHEDVHVLAESEKFGPPKKVNSSEIGII